MKASLKREFLQDSRPVDLKSGCSVQVPRVLQPRAMSAHYRANKKIGERVVTGEIRKRAKAKIIYDKAMGSLLRDRKSVV